MFFKKISAVLAITIGLTPLASVAQDMTLTLAHQYPDTQPIGDGYNTWAKRVEELSDGAIKVRVFPGSTLIGSDEAFAAVSSRSVDASNMIGGFQVGDIPQLAVLALPFMFDDYDHYRRAMDAGLFDMVEGWYAEKGIKLLNLFPKGASQVFHKESFLLAPADFQGARLRGVGGAMSAALLALGANEVRLPTTEVAPALQRGVVDGIITNCVAHIGRSWYEQTPYVSVLDFSNDGEGLGLNMDIWNGLSEEQQGILQQAAEEMNDFEWGMIRQVEEKGCFDDWARLNVNVEVATPEQRAALAETLAPVYAEYAAELPVLEEVLAIVEQAR